jgi:hypothetical protein
MESAKFEPMDWLSIVLGLCVACGGKIGSPGDERMVGGTAGRDAQGTGDVDDGGAATGGVGVGGTGTGVAGVAGNVGLPPYVQDPTLPIDPSCTCRSPDEICNAAQQCVPRCDAASRCALWLSPHGIVDIYLDGSSVFFLTASPHDPSGRPIGDGSLYRADYPSGTPTLIATGIKDGNKIIGRRDRATVVHAWHPSSSMIHVSDGGIVTTLASVIDNETSVPSMLENWTTYIDTSGKRLWGMDLDRGFEPQLLVDMETAVNPEGPQLALVSKHEILDDYFWFGAYGADDSIWSCYLSRSNLAAGPTCHQPGWTFDHDIVATTGNQLFSYSGFPSLSLESLDITGESRRKLFSGALYFGATYSRGWLYSVVDDPPRLIRYPTAVGRLPQEVLAADVAVPAFATVCGDNNVAVGPNGVFWYQGVTDLNQAQYIFHAPLPPQPCDLELPCEQSGESCVAGYCG